MKTIFISLGLILSIYQVNAQQEEQKWIIDGDQTSPPENSVLTSTATIASGNQVAYKAGRSIVLLPGFKAKAGSIFTAFIHAAAPEHDPDLFSVATYPNPFEKVTTIQYTLRKAGRTSLQVYDIHGRQIHQLIDRQYQEAGQYSFEWNGNEVPAGTYLCILDIGQQRIVRRLVRK